jgi:hypothetical protein
MPWEAAIPVFAISAAAILVGGTILLRFQRDRHHFLLAHMALERGITTFPGAIPGWLLSLRVGVLTLVLGLGLASSGIFFYQTAGDLQDSPIAAPAPRVPPATTVDRPRPAGDTESNAPHAPPPPVWHRIQNQRIASLVTFCVGVILVLLGLVRILFARAERFYTDPIAPAPTRPNAP